MFRRVIIKVSGEGLSGNSDGHFHDKTVARIVKEVNTLVSQGVQVSLVVGGGNFWRGRDASPEMDKVRAHQIGMLATVMNGIYLAEAFRTLSKTGERAVVQKAVVMTPFEIGAFTERYTRDTAIAYMETHVVPIFAGGTGHPFFSTDSIVAIRACELGVDAVLYAKNVRCVYEDDPRKDIKARKYKTVSYETVLAKRLSVADISAVALTAQEGIPSVVFGLSENDGMIIACQNDDSLFKIGGTRVANRLADEFYE